MALVLRQSTAVDVLIGPFVDGTDGATPEEALSPSVQVSKNGQTSATKNDVTTPVHDNGGFYNCELDATDTNTIGTLVLWVEGTTATHLAVRHEFQVIDEVAYDAIFADGATDYLPVNVHEINTSSTAAAQLALSADTVESGAAEGTPTTTSVQTDLAETQDDIYIGRIIIFTSGNARGEATEITAYTGSTGTIGCEPLANAPASTDTFVII